MTVEILTSPSSDELSISTEQGGQQLLLWLHKRCSATKTFALLDSPFCIDSAASIDKLRAKVSEISGVPLEHMTLAKLLPYNGKWRKLELEEEEKKEEKTEKIETTEEEREQQQQQQRGW